MSAGRARAAGLLSQVGALSDEKFIAALDVLVPVADEPEITQFIEGVRPRLRQLRPARRPSLKRLLCEPIEDLLVGAAEGDGAGIPRAAIAPCWQLLQQREGERMRALAAALAELPRAEPKKLMTLGHSLWKLAARALAAAGEKDSPLALIGSIMSVAGEIQSFKQLVPVKPLLRLVKSETACREIKAALARIAEKRLSAEAYLLAVAARLESPGELFALLRVAEIPLPAAAARALGRHVIADILAHSGRLEDTKIMAPEVAAHEADRLARLVEAAKGGLNGQMGKELERSAAHAAGVIELLLREHVIEPAAGAITVPASGADPSHAESHARALGRSRRLAGQVGLEARINGTIGVVRKRLEEAVESALANRAAGVQPALLYGAIRLIELVAGPEEAERLLRRAQPRLTAAPV